MYQGRKPILRQSYILTVNHGVIQILMGRKPGPPGPEHANSVRTSLKLECITDTQDFLLPLHGHMDLHGRQSHQCSNSLFLAQRLSQVK